MWSVERKTDVT